ncbi:MAG: 16S rRNA processing protein RimM [Proteobacteria bacterium]|nr:16S rRNA processing protein RimM [Pseudomonadota bacterium]NDC23547.1 16S rRNA processing protein RimM [Pseudomonadota bacterium]NDD03665.1 16S rRNA processing protein RimM [Pseudomonadota bacterium]NDG25840.1 16S rRNA processing protein RimM [Pseudomonadota bacterium]
MKLIQIAYISKLHGYKGAVVASTDSGKGSALGYVSQIYLGASPDQSHPHEIRSANWMPKGWKLELADITNEQSAKALVGQAVYVLRDELNPPSHNEYYVSDLVGLKAFEKDSNKELGTFVSLNESSPLHAGVKASSWVFAGPRGEFSVPAIKRFIYSVDLPAGIIWLQNLKDLE